MKISTLILSILFTFFYSTFFSQSFDESLKQFHLLRSDGKMEKAYRLISDLEKTAQNKNGEDLPRIYLELAKYHFSADNFDEAKKFTEKSFELGSGSSKIENKAYGIFARAYYFYQLNLDETAMRYAKQASAVLEKNELSPYGLSAEVYYLLYRISSHFDDFQLANRYADKSIKMAQKAKHYDLLANSFAAKSNAMEFNYNKTKDKLYKDSIKIYLDKSLSLYKSHSDKIAQRTFAITNINLANVHYKEFSKKNSETERQKILYYLNSAEQLDPAADFNFELRGNVLGLRSQLAMSEKKYDQTEFYLKTALANLTLEKKRPAYFTIFNIVSALQEFYKETKNYKQAVFYAEKKSDYQKKMFDESSASNIRSLEAKFENEKIGNQLKTSEEVSEQRKMQNYLLSAILLLLCTTVYFILRNFRNKFNLQKKRTENFEKDKLRAIAELNLENEARKSLAAEQKILKLENEKSQKDALVHTLLLEQKNRVLKEIGEQVKKEGGKWELQNTLRQDAKAEQRVNEKASEFENVNPVFFTKMQEKYGDKLTVRDIKLCAYLFLGLGNKEISEILKVEPKTIRMGKYRIKKKLELPPEMTLEEKIMEMMQEI